jgi:hypothetical protein
MFNKKRGFLTHLKDKFPVSRTEARRRAHNDLINAARVQVSKGIMLGLQHALSQKHEPLQEPERLWWKAQTVKWETIWRMLNEASVDLTDFRKISDLNRVSDAAFRLYEQMAIEAMTALLEVPSETLREEALRWRETGTLLASLHRHCLMDRLHESKVSTGKNAGVSGIKEVKES